MKFEDAKVGVKVKNTSPLNGVPEGTLGVIVEDWGAYVVVRWRRYPGDFLKDFFDKQSELSSFVVL